MRAIGPDLAYAERTFVRNPGFTAAAVLETLLFGVNASDPLTFGSAAVLFLAVAMARPTMRFA